MHEPERNRRDWWKWVLRAVPAVAAVVKIIVDITGKGQGPTG